MSLRTKPNKYSRRCGRNYLSSIYQEEKQSVMWFCYQSTAFWTLLVSLLLGVGIVLLSHSTPVNAQMTKSRLSIHHHKAGDLVIKEIGSRIRKALPKTKIDWIRYTVINGLYEFKMGRNIMYTDKTGQYLVVGHVFDMINNRNLTRIALDKYVSKRKPNTRKQRVARASKKLLWKTLPLSAAVRYGNPKGQKIAIFHDPDCPYCIRMKNEMLKSNQFDVYQIMYPIQSLHPKAFLKSQAILCRAKKVAANKCDMAKVIKGAIDFAKRHNIRGTPTVVAADGRVFVGYRPAKQLIGLLQKKNIVMIQSSKK